MPSPVPRVALVIVLALVCLASRPEATTRPTLIVLLVVDQLRADYLETYGSQWTQGLRRLLERGAVFTRAAFPYMNTVTCAGHATVATGALPSVHGMILNEWWDRKTQRAVTCTFDAQAPIVSYGQPVPGGHSARRLAVPTLADQMRASLTPAPRVVSISMKPRSAMMMAGQGGDVVLWYESRTWGTSTAYADRPQPLIASWLRHHPIEADARLVWRRSLPLDRYRHPDPLEGKRPPGGWGRSLPHSLGDPAHVTFYTRWEHSPFADEHLAELALHVTEQLRLGQRAATDYLAVGFSALDRIGHTFGPESHEVQDALVRLDATIGRVLDRLDALVGDRYVVALSADHGVSPVPEQLLAAGQDAGRIRTTDLTDRAERALAGVLGPGRYVARTVYTDLYLAPGVSERLRANRRAVAAVLQALSTVRGVARVYEGEALAREAEKGDPLARAALNSYYPGRSGDIIIVPKPNWIISTAAATHGSGSPYDTEVPLVLSGVGIRAGRYTSEATPADIAPTLAHLIGVKLPRATGRVLEEAIRGPVGPTGSGASR